jgi:hypothetical protein
MSLFLDIGTGSGLASSTGIRPYLPTALAGALAAGDVGIDFDGTDLSWLESPVFLGVVLALAVGVFLLERSQPARAATSSGGPAARRPVEILSGLFGLAFGALLFAAALEDGGQSAWIGLVFGPLCAALAWVAVGGLVERVRTRLEAEQAALLTAYAEAVALLLAAIAILVPPVALLAIPAFVLLLAGGRRREGQKYAGLRILR